MSLVRVHNFSVSLDGFGTGEGQRLDAPFGHAGSRLMEWAFETRTFREMGIHGESAGSLGVDEAFASKWGPGIGVEIMGRNKFGPQRGPWEDEEWKGWWGDNPVFHTPVVVLTHHPRPVLEMEGGTTFHFVDADPVAALEQARALAGDLDVRIGGGVSTVRQFLEARSDRPHARRPRADRPGPGRTALGWTRRTRTNALTSRRPLLHPEFST